jgi:phenylalanyl-tRNA synthetase beta chain
MIISYNWLSEYLPTRIEPEKLSKILTAIGLEVESLHKFESIKGGLQGLITAEIVECEPHPDADKLKVTRVNTGTEILQVVCGAPNAAAGQKVILAKTGTTIYPLSGEPMTLKKVKIRGVESNGMICAEDEIGIGASHEGIMVLPADTAIGQPAASLFETYSDIVLEIGLTPNRMDAMSHLGVAKDVCAWLSHHDKKGSAAVLPYKNTLKTEGKPGPIKVKIENPADCQRYSGVSITGITVSDSPKWLQQKLQTIGVKSINNIVDLTNFILHESGQPLHAFDADKITGNSIIVKNLPEGSVFTTLDEKERKLTATDLVICNAEEGMCIAGVYGGIKSGVTAATKNVFLESAWFHPQSIRKTSVHHGLRTDAATRFEKGVDISNTVTVLKRAAELIVQICGGKITGDIVDVYPKPANPVEVGLKYHYLKKLSGKNYHGDTIKNILLALGFGIVKEGMDEIRVNVPFSKPDISIPADIVEEIMRIDGLDNIDIPSAISIAPSRSGLGDSNVLKEKIANQLTGLGFHEIFTNSITNSQYYDEAMLGSTVRMMNNLSVELDIMRPTMLPTGLEVIAHNINRKNADLLLFENGKTYLTSGPGSYEEQKHLSLFTTGNARLASWNQQPVKADYFFLKSICEKVLLASGIVGAHFEDNSDGQEQSAEIKWKKNKIGQLGLVPEKVLKQFGIKQPVFYADLFWDQLVELRNKKSFAYREISKFPPVQRDLALVLDKKVTYAQLKETVGALKVQQLQAVKLFDIFESEKLGPGKKSMAVNFTFLDSSKTLTDKEIDDIMNNLISAFEKDLQAEVRK